MLREKIRMDPLIVLRPSDPSDSSQFRFLDSHNDHCCEWLSVVRRRLFHKRNGAIRLLESIASEREQCCLSLRTECGARVLEH
jgi:hypothetical protein